MEYPDHFSVSSNRCHDVPELQKDCEGLLFYVRRCGTLHPCRLTTFAYPVCHLRSEDYFTPAAIGHRNDDLPKPAPILYPPMPQTSQSLSRDPPKPRYLLSMLPASQRPPLEVEYGIYTLVSPTLHMGYQPSPRDHLVLFPSSVLPTGYQPSPWDHLVLFPLRFCLRARRAAPPFLNSPINARKGPRQR